MHAPSDSCSDAILRWLDSTSITRMCSLLPQRLVTRPRYCLLEQHYPCNGFAYCAGVGKCADDTRPETFCDVLLRTFHGCDPACGYHWALTKDKYYKENHVTGDELVGGRNVREHADNGGAVVHKLQGECLQTATQNGSPKSSYCEQVYSNKGCSVACGLNWSARQHVCQIGGLADEL